MAKTSSTGTSCLEALERLLNLDGPLHLELSARNHAGTPWRRPAVFGQSLSAPDAHSGSDPSRAGNPRDGGVSQ